jgi:hypothetical protein
MKPARCDDRGYVRRSPHTGRGLLEFHQREALWCEQHQDLPQQSGRSAEAVGLCRQGCPIQHERLHERSTGGDGNWPIQAAGSKVGDDIDFRPKWR